MHVALYPHTILAVLITGDFHKLDPFFVFRRVSALAVIEGQLLIPVLSERFTYKRVNSPFSSSSSQMFSVRHTCFYLSSWISSIYNPVLYVFETPYLLSKVLDLETDELQNNFGPRFGLFLLTLERYFEEPSISEFDSFDAQDNLALFHVSENADESSAIRPIMSFSSVETTTRAPTNVSHAVNASNSTQGGIVTALTELNIKLLNSLPSVDDGGYLDIALQLLAVLSLSLCTVCLICATVV